MSIVFNFVQLEKLQALTGNVEEPSGSPYRAQDHLVVHFYSCVGVRNR